MPRVRPFSALSMYELASESPEPLTEPQVTLSLDVFVHLEIHGDFLNYHNYLGDGALTHERLPTSQRDGANIFLQQRLGPGTTGN